MLYDSLSALVHTPFVHGRQATDEELHQDGLVVEQVAIAWLAHRGLLYGDLRAPDVIVERSREDKLVAHVTDYDDMVIVTPSTVRSTDALLAKVVANAVSRSLRSSSGIGDRPALRRLLDEALKVMREGSAQGEQLWPCTAAAYGSGNRCLRRPARRCWR